MTFIFHSILTDIKSIKLITLCKKLFINMLHIYFNRENTCMREIFATLYCKYNIAFLKWLCIQTDFVQYPVYCTYASKELIRNGTGDR